MPDRFFQIQEVGAANVVALSLPESMDSGEFDRLNEEVLSALATGPQQKWIIDLAGVDYMGSSALGLMVNIRQRIKQSGGSLVLCGLSPRLLRIFHTCCMERLFTLTKNRDDALRAIAR